MFLRNHMLSGLTLSLFLFTFFLTGCDKKEPAETPNPETNGTPQANADGVVDPPSVGTYPATQAEIQGWIDKMDMKAIRGHAWDIWAAITSPSGQGDLPVWETWYSGYDLFVNVDKKEKIGQARIRPIETPSQFHHASNLAGGITADRAEQVTSFNRYTASLAQFIWDNSYNKASVLDSINKGFDAAGTPVIDRQVLLSPDSVNAKAISIKPVFQYISGTEPTAVPYWNGISPTTTTNLDNPEPHTWRQAVVVDPTGKLKPGSTVEMAFNGEPKKPLKVVSLDDFYHFTLTQDEVDHFSVAARGVGENNMGDTTNFRKMVKEGNIGLLVGMHVTTKEIPNWTWQTFWWAADPNDPQHGTDRPASVTGAWAHYNMVTAFFMVTPPGDPNGDPIVGFNPYLETNLKGDIPGPDGSKIHWTGTTSSCMSCHRLAAWQQNPNGPKPNTPHYQPNGFIDPADSALFAGYTKLDFLWSVTRAR